MSENVPEAEVAKIQIEEEAVADNQIKVEALEPSISRLSAEAAKFYPNYGITALSKFKRKENLWRMPRILS